MNEEKEKWIDSSLHSMKGSQRAKPSPDLFANIKRQIVNLDSQIVPLRQWRYAVASAILILTINTTALLCFNQQKQAEEIDATVTNNYDRSLISSFQIYK